VRQTSIRNTLATLMIATLGVGFAGRSVAGEPTAAPANLINPVFGTYTVTEEADGQWKICWQGQAKPQRFNGRIYSAEGSAIDVSSHLRGVAIAQVAANQVTFDAATDAREQQCLDVVVNGDHEQVRVDLAINGVEATNPFLLFASFESLPSDDLVASLR
jgi:hypothetical protein